MKSKYFSLTILCVLFLSVQKGRSQIGDNQTYVQHKPIDSKTILEEFSRLRFKEISDDKVLVTTLGKRNKSLDLSKAELKKSIFKNYFQKDLKFTLSSVLNAGYVITITQCSKENEIPIRFFTLFLSHKTGKIVVIEIEENR